MDKPMSHAARLYQEAFAHAAREAAARAELAGVEPVGVLSDLKLSDIAFVAGSSQVERDPLPGHKVLLRGTSALAHSVRVSPVLPGSDAGDAEMLDESKGVTEQLR
jgi:hypothetical protein